jgi:hypothetical protein
MSMVPDSAFSSSTEPLSASVTSSDTTHQPAEMPASDSVSDEATPGSFDF